MSSSLAVFDENHTIFICWLYQFKLFHVFDYCFDQAVIVFEKIDWPIVRIHKILLHNNQKYEIVYLGCLPSCKRDKISSLQWHLEDVTQDSRSHIFGSISPGDIVHIVRQVVVDSLSAIAVVLDNTWAFCVSFDGATHSNKGYFDVKFSCSV